MNWIDLATKKLASIQMDAGKSLVSKGLIQHPGHASHTAVSYMSRWPFWVNTLSNGTYTSERYGEVSGRHVFQSELHFSRSADIHAESLFDPFITAFRDRIFADLTLGGSVNGVTGISYESSGWDYSNGDSHVGLTFEIEFSKSEYPNSIYGSICETEDGEQLDHIRQLVRIQEATNFHLKKEGVFSHAGIALPTSTRSLNSFPGWINYPQAGELRPSGKAFSLELHQWVSEFHLMQGDLAKLEPKLREAFIAYIPRLFADITWGGAITQLMEVEYQFTGWSYPSGASSVDHVGIQFISSYELKKGYVPIKVV